MTTMAFLLTCTSSTGQPKETLSWPIRPGTFWRQEASNVGLMKREDMTMVSLCHFYFCFLTPKYQVSFCSVKSTGFVTFMKFGLLLKILCILQSCTHRETHTDTHTHTHTHTHTNTPLPQHKHTPNTHTHTDTRLSSSITY